MRTCYTFACLIFAALLPAAASEAVYQGPPLEASYEGPVLVDNSQLLYTAADRLSFSTSAWLNDKYPHLLPLRPAIDTWASRLGLHPRVLVAMADGYFSGSPIRGRDDFGALIDLASALATALQQQKPADPLAATRAVMAVAEALHFDLDLPSQLSRSRRIPAAAETTAALVGYFQPPWPTGETWAGGGAHGTSHNALDFWGTFRNWGEDTSGHWVSAMQSGTVRVWSSCGLSVIHGNGWVTDYYHLDNIQVSDFSTVERNVPLANYADNEAQATCAGGWSTGPHVHMSLTENGSAVSVDQIEVDFTAFSHHAGVGDYDGDCSTSWYDHYSAGKVCPYWDQLLNDAPSPSPVFADGFESGNTSAWSGSVP